MQLTPSPSAVPSQGRSAVRRATPPERAHGTGILDGVPASPASVGEAFECLRVVSDRLRGSGDPRAAFTDVYAVITRKVRDATRGGAASPFVEPGFISRLAGRFCALYLAALGRSLKGAPEPSRAWASSARHGASAGTLPVQHALLGLNAHINYDLALGLFETVRALGAGTRRSVLARYRHDHDAVNRILEEAIPEALSLLANRYGCRAARRLLRSEHLGRALCKAMAFTLRIWRARVWRDLEAMLAAPDAGERARITARMDRRSGWIAGLLGLPRGAKRAAWLLAAPGPRGL